jgi:hypothetical protein
VGERTSRWSRTYCAPALHLHWSAQYGQRVSGGRPPITSNCNSCCKGGAAAKEQRASTVSWAIGIGRRPHDGYASQCFMRCSMDTSPPQHYFTDCCVVVRPSKSARTNDTLLESLACPPRSCASLCHSWTPIQCHTKQPLANCTEAWNLRNEIQASSIGTYFQCPTTITAARGSVVFRHHAICSAGPAEL